MIEAINPYSIKILISAQDGDSIRKISIKTGISYGWTYHWIEQLEKADIIKKAGNKIRINKANKTYGKLLDLAKEALSLSDYYQLPGLSGLRYAYTGIDAVFIWTKGGYNIGRSMDSYPIFIKMLRNDFEKWKIFFSKLDINYSIKPIRKPGIYLVLELAEEFKADIIENASVISLNETIEFCKKYIYNFQPALEMLDEMYGIKTGIKYKEAVLNV